MCEVTEGYDITCDDAGGTERVYWYSVKDDTGASNVDTRTVVNGQVTDLTLKAGKYAYSLNVEIETATFNDNAVGERANKAYAREQDSTVILHGNTAAMIAMLDTSAKGRIGLIHKLNDGTYEHLFLENGAVMRDSRTPGTAYEDMNGNTLTFTGKEKAKAPKISEAIVLALLATVS